MVDGDSKLKPAIDSTGGGISVGSDSGEGSGVATSPAELESEDSRMRFEDDSDEGEREDDDGDGESCSDDTEIFEAAGVIARCATLVPFGTRLGSGAIFLREDDFAFGDGSSSALRSSGLRKRSHLLLGERLPHCRDAYQTVPASRTVQ